VLKDTVQLRNSYHVSHVKDDNKIARKQCHITQRSHLFVNH